MRKPVLSVAVLVTLMATPVLADEWRYDAALYAWLAGLDGTIGVGQAGDVPVEASFDDLVGYLDFALAVHAEAKTDKVLLLTDINYVGLTASRDAVVAGKAVEIDMDYAQWIVELGGGYRVTNEFDVILTGRYYVQDPGVTTTSVAGANTGGDTESWADVFLGGRYSRALGARWLVSVRGDIGAGGSDFAWFANALVAYRFTESFSTGAYYRVLDIDYETGEGADYYKYDINTNGPGLAFGWSF